MFEVAKVIALCTLSVEGLFLAAAFFLYGLQTVREEWQSMKRNKKHVAP